MEYRVYQSFYKQQEYKFPLTFSKKEEIKKKWLHNLNRKLIPEMLSVFSEHFQWSCFKRDLQAEFMGTKPRNILMMQFQPLINTLRALLEKEFLHLREKISKSRNS